MSSFLHRRTFLGSITAIIFMVGIAAGFWRYFETRDAARESLLIKVRRSAAAFDGTELRQLSGSPTDIGTPPYQQVKTRLRRLRQVESTVREVAILRHDAAGGRFIYLADSETPNSPEFTAPGHVYAEPTNSPGLAQLMATGAPSTEGPREDRSGQSLIGYGPIGEFAGNRPVHVLALTLAANDFQQHLLTSALGTAGYVWLLLVLPLVALVSNWRQAEQRDALRNLTEAMEQGHSAVVIIDLERCIEYANAEFCRQFGYTRRELIGREWRELHVTDTAPEVVADVVSSVRAGQAWSGEWQMRRKDGTVFPGHGRITPVKDRWGNIRSFVAVFDDVTELRRTEMVLREAKERAEAGDRAKGQFLATMSHEVRTPLNGIVGFASLLLDTELTPEQQEYVETIRTSSETLIQLTGDILDFARIESGRLKLEPQPCDPRECVENALDLVAAAAIHKNIELLHWVDESVPSAIVADVSRLRQVVVNLVNNAVKFTTEGEVEVRVSAERPRSTDTPDEPWTLVFSVRDTGIGIAPEHHHRIFRPFSQADESTTRRYGGTGLGLAICKNIVELMNGTISFTSEIGRGSTFTFTIKTPAIESPAPRLAPLQDQRLAIVTESPGLRHELSRLATRLGAQPVHRDRAALAATEDWSLAIVDVTGASALELAAAKSKPSLPAGKLIALVPIVLPGELRDALRSQFRLVLNKPLHHDMLASLLAAPPAPVTEAVNAPAPAAPPPSPMIGDEPPDGFGLDVLIVEDNPVNQRLIQKVISNLGCRWTAALNGRLAIEELGRTTPDVVLMDLHMPELDGLTTITKIRAGEAGAAVRDVWIIALTADARDDQRARTLSAGANDYLTKPVRLPELTAAFERFRDARK